MYYDLSGPDENKIKKVNILIFIMFKDYHILINSFYEEVQVKLQIIILNAGETADFLRGKTHYFTAGNNGQYTVVFVFI